MTMTRPTPGERCQHGLDACSRRQDQPDRGRELRQPDEANERGRDRAGPNHFFGELGNRHGHFHEPAIPNITAKSTCTTQSAMFHAFGAD